MVPTLMALGIAALPWLTSGCGNSCKELSERVCRCEPTEPAQQACIQRVDSEAASKDLTNAQQETCEAILDADTCKCDRLEDGDLAACGLTLTDESGK